MNSLFQTWHNDLSLRLDQLIDEMTPNHRFREVIRYSSLPAGKLFRPLLVLALAKDLNALDENHYQFALAIEMHHTYTLIHDDLPAMDNDDYRRGRPSSHKKFSEFEAILAGDALINMSYEATASINHPSTLDLIRKMSHYTGAKGLVFGQVKDLSHENSDFDQLKLIHELKTSRLIQLCLVGATMLSNRNDLLSQIDELGVAMGINFQLLDDLCELSEIQSGHELEINPFISFNGKFVLNEVNKNLTLIENTLKELNLINLKEFYHSYLNKIQETIVKGKENILKQSGLSDITNIF